MEFMKDFKNQARSRRLCSQYAILWGQCKTKEDYVRLSLMPSSIPYIATSSLKGWGVSTDDIYNNFGDIINGKKTIKDIDGVKDTTAVLYVKFDGKKKQIKENIVHIMETIGTIFTIKETKCPAIHVSNNSSIKIKGEGYNTISLHLYDNSNVDITDVKTTTKIFCYKYSQQCTVTCDETKVDIKFINKELKL